jgi:hypothetical protein
LSESLALSVSTADPTGDTGFGVPFGEVTMLNVCWGAASVFATTWTNDPWTLRPALSFTVTRTTQYRSSPGGGVQVGVAAAELGDRVPLFVIPAQVTRQKYDFGNAWAMESTVVTEKTTG